MQPRVIVEHLLRPFFDLDVRRQKEQHPWQQDQHTEGVADPPMEPIRQESSR
jgi:hypothetical protein